MFSAITRALLISKSHVIVSQDIWFAISPTYEPISDPAQSIGQIDPVLVLVKYWYLVIRQAGKSRIWLTFA